MTICAGMYILRNFRVEDALPYYQIAHDKAVEMYVNNAFPEDLDEADALVEWYSQNSNNRDFYFAIHSKNNKSIIGAIIATQRELGILDVSAFVANEYRRHGVMNTCLKAFISWIRRRHPEIEEIHFDVKKNNEASNMQIIKFGAEIQPKKDRLYNYYKIKL